MTVMIENIFDNDNDDDYYKPILVEGSFKNNYKYYESRGDKDKKTIGKATSVQDYAIFKRFNK